MQINFIKLYCPWLARRLLLVSSCFNRLPSSYLWQTILQKLFICFCFTRVLSFHNLAQTTEKVAFLPGGLFTLFFRRGGGRFFDKSKISSSANSNNYQKNDKNYFPIHMIKNFLPPKLKYGSSRCFSPGSFAVLSGAAPPPFRPPAGGFAGDFPRQNERLAANRTISSFSLAVPALVR